MRNAKSTIKKSMTVIIVMLLLCACGKEKTENAKPQKLSDDFSSTAEITQGDFSCTANIKRGGNGTWQWEFTKPESISGMTVTLSNDTCSIDFMELCYSMPYEKLSNFSMISLISDSIDNLISGKDVKCTVNDEIKKENGTVNGQDYTAKIKNGKLTQIEIAKDISAQFT